MNPFIRCFVNVKSVIYSSIMATGRILETKISEGVDAERFYGEAIRRNPFILVSSHGGYNFSEFPMVFNQRGVDLKNTKLVENVHYIRLLEGEYAFESSEPGLDINTFIDEPLWELLQDRVLFENVLKNGPDPWPYPNVSRPLLPDRHRINSILRALHIYMPGDIIFKRTLSLTPREEFNLGWWITKWEPANETHIDFPKENYTPKYRKDPSIILSAAEQQKKDKKAERRIIDGIAKMLPIIDVELENLRDKMLETEQSDISVIIECRTKYPGRKFTYLFPCCGNIEGERDKFRAQKSAFVEEHIRGIDIRNGTQVGLQYNGNYLSDTSYASGPPADPLPPELRRAAPLEAAGGLSAFFSGAVKQLTQFSSSLLKGKPVVAPVVRAVDYPEQSKLKLIEHLTGLYKALGEEKSVDILAEKYKLTSDILWDALITKYGEALVKKYKDSYDLDMFYYQNDLLAEAGLPNNANARIYGNKGVLSPSGGTEELNAEELTGWSRAPLRHDNTLTQVFSGPNVSNLMPVKNPERGNMNLFDKTELYFLLLENTDPKKKYFKPDRRTKKSYIEITLAEASRDGGGGGGGGKGGARRTRKYRRKFRRTMRVTYNKR